MHYDKGFDTGSVATHLGMALHHLQAVRSIREFEVENERYAPEDSAEPHYISHAEDAFMKDAVAKVDDLRSRVIDRAP